MLRLIDVHKSFGDLVVLDGVSLDFQVGQTTAIIGPSGTGKSVLLKHLVGLIQADSGTVECFGVDMARATEAELYGVRRRVGMLFQDGALFDSMSVGENIAFPLVHHERDLSPAQRQERVEQALEDVDLAGFSDRDTASLSGGQRKRVGLARAIIHRPEVVLFDEPTSGLDPTTSDAIDALILRMKERLGVTFIVISHDIVGVMNVADQVGMLHNGHLIAYGPPSELVHDSDPVLRRFLSRNLLLPRDPSAPPTLPGLKLQR